MITLTANELYELHKKLIRANDICLGQGDKLHL
jgi:hypothetical protein